MKNITKDALHLIFGNGAPALIGLICLPFIIKGLGASNFGVLTLIWAIIGLGSIFDFGVGRAMTYEISICSSNNKAQKEKIFTSGLLLTGGIALLITPLACFGSRYLIMELDWLGNLDKPLLVKTFILSMLAIVPTTINAVIRGALEGESNFFGSMINRSLLGSAMFLMPCLDIIYFSGSLDRIALSLLIVRVLLCFMAFLQLGYRISYPSKELAKKILHYGKWVAISNFLSPIMVYGDRFFITSIIGPSSLQLYVVPQELIQRILILPSSISNSLLPKLSYQTNKESSYRNYKTIERVIGVIIIISIAICLIFGKLFFSEWISFDFYTRIEKILLILYFGLFFNSLAQISVVILSAINKPHAIGLAHIVEFPVYMGLLYFFIRIYGIDGAAYAWTTRVIIDYAILRYIVYLNLK